MNNSIPSLTIGIDLGDKRHAICVLDFDGSIVEQRTITNHKESLGRLSKKFPQARIIMETGTHSPWISRMLQQLDNGTGKAQIRTLLAHSEPRDRAQ